MNSRLAANALRNRRRAPRLVPSVLTELLTLGLVLVSIASAGVLVALVVQPWVAP